MKDKDTTENNEEIMDTKGGAVAVATPTAVSTEVTVQGVNLEFPFIRLGQGMSQWKAGGKKPVLGAFYIGKNRDNNVMVAEMGKDAGIYGIVLQKVEGFKEERKWQAGMGAPKRWLVAGTKEDGTPVTEADCLNAAAEEGFSLAPKPTGDVWPDSGRPILRANLSRFCYLMMLVPLPDDFDSDEYSVFPIGDKLYTTARYEFDRQYYKQMSSILNNIKSRAEFAARREGKTDFIWSINGLVVHLYSTEATNRQGIEYITPMFEKALRDGKPWEFTADEKKDFVTFLSMVNATVTTLDSDDMPEF